MRERRQLVDLWQCGNAAVLVTLIGVEGSSYRREGARLLIASDGTYAGGISGGCFEAEVIRKAQWKVRNGAVIDRYSTLFDDTADIPYGLGCGGTVDLLLEPANTPEFDALMRAMQASLQGQTQYITTHLPTSTAPLRRDVSGAPGPDSRTRVFGASRISDDNQSPSTEAFTETFDPPQRLILFGAGDDAQPVLDLATLLGWNTTIIDSRPQWASPSRFPAANFVTTSLIGITITAHDAVVIMTHSYEQDRAWLAAVLPSHPRYLGLLGARHRSALLIAEAAAILNCPIDEACTHIFAPVGLDLGGDGAEAIALATIAEIQACIEGKLGHSRRMTPAIIADQLEKGGATQYLQTQCAI